MTATVDDGGLSIPDVVAQFRRSEQTLEAVRERLKSLVLTEEGADRAATSIESAASTLRDTALALDRMVGEIKEVRDATLTALGAARRFLDGTDVDGLRRDFDAFTTEVRGDLAATRAGIGRLNENQPKIESLQAELERAKQLLGRKAKQLDG